MMKRGTADQLVARLRAEPTDECVDWPGCMDARGYGRARSNTAAHRWVYMEIVGSIPEGLDLDHLCRRRSCVNPRHLEPVTGLRNWWRGESITRINATKTHCKHGHEFTPENTFIRRPGWRACRTCERERAMRRKAS